VRTIETTSCQANREVRNDDLSADCPQRVGVTRRRHADHPHAGAAGGLDPDGRILEHHARGGRNPEPRGRRQVNLGVRLAPLNVTPGDLRAEVLGQP
jgi:hypothetical protein